ncbi:MAG: VacJ family lipoprotein [Proteobacteria bacterium]|nr:VacJ family lipoprotein [Pseudomonadota bacterium]
MLFDLTPRLAGIFAAAALLAACTATPPTDPEALAAYEEANDPLEPTNRAIFDFNQGFDRALLKPAAEGYREIFPDGVRSSINNVLHNVRSPVILANDILQGESVRAVETITRFAVNTVLGMGGLFDVAGQYGMERHTEDFGQTLAVWGFGEGFYLMLPVFGPSNPRDTVGLVVDSFIDPLGYFVSFPVTFGRSAVEGIDKRSRALEPLDEIERTSVDFYATIRSLYRQRREDEIRNGEPGGNIPAPSISFEFLEDEETLPVQPAAGVTIGENARPKSNEVSELMR